MRMMVILNLVKRQITVYWMRPVELGLAVPPTVISGPRPGPGAGPGPGPPTTISGPLPGPGAGPGPGPGPGAGPGPLNPKSKEGNP